MSDNTGQDPAAAARLSAFVGVVAGYIAACLATVVGFFGTGVVMGGGHLPLSENLGMIVGSFALVLGLALPGFVLMRLALHWTSRKDGFSFAIAGGLNGVATIGVMQVFDWLSGAGPAVGSPWGMYAFFVGLGVAAGLACWATERLVAWCNRTALGES